jgi:fatty acid desaturase
MNAALLRAPRVAWPTIALGFLATGSWLAVLGLTLSGELPLWLALPLATVSAYAAFTPMHDSAHRSVGRARWLNEAVGRLAGLPLLAPFPAFRFMHLEHHKHANEADADPDHWSGRGPRLLLPLRWLTQDLHYYARFFADRQRFSGAEQAEVVGGVALQVAAVAGLCALGQVGVALCCVLLPARLATGMLAFAFDYLPHRPHLIPARADRFRATHIIAGRWWTVPLCCQNYHLVHHLYPAVPFYGYGRVWWDQREELLAQGAREVPLLGAVPD